MRRLRASVLGQSEGEPSERIGRPRLAAIEMHHAMAGAQCGVGDRTADEDRAPEYEHSHGAMLTDTRG